MKRFLAAALLLAIGSCVAPPAPPPPPAPMSPAPRAATPAPLSSDWRDWPLTPGDWRYAPTAQGSVARFGDGRLTLQCDRAARTIVLTIGGPPGQATIRTSSTVRVLTLAVATGGAAATLPATDPLLDAMGFSRGRFVVQQAGAAPLVVPAWAEILRVTEDCRG